MGKLYSPGFMKTRYMVTMAALLLFISGCSGGSSSTKTGHVMDGPVEGITYTSGSLSGKTDADGTFKYAGENEVTFSIGGITLGSSCPGASVVTPVDWVGDAVTAENEEVANILVFLQSLDEDQYPENGILISDATSTLLKESSLDFSLAEDSFRSAAQVLVDLVFNDGRDLISREDAVNHFTSSILSMVETTRDDKGVWFIRETGFGATLYAVMEAMGYNVARDRLWQAELYRRTGSGRLAELFGADYLNQDVLVRTTGYSQSELEAGYLALDREDKTLVKAYADGFNRRIREIQADSSQLPFEFAAMGISPEPWDEKDVLGWVFMLLRQFDCEATDQGQLDNAALLNELQMTHPSSFMAMFNDLRWVNDPEALTYIPNSSTVKGLPGRTILPSSLPTGSIPDLREVAAGVKKLYAAMDDNLKKINAKVKMGSYAWVVSGDRTVSGNPIIYSGPQMGFSVPSIVAEGSIQGAGLKISGMTVPGIPGIIIGRTPHHAWSMQVGHAHTVDYYIESSSDISPLPRMETIKVAGSEDVTIPVWTTDHGPVISPLPYDPATYDSAVDGPIVTWRYANKQKEFSSLGGILQLARAGSMDEFGQGIEDLALSQHFCYADRDGNIAYWMSGADPVRPEEGDYRLPQGTLGPVLEWDETQLREKSTDRNTSQGFYSGWNNKTGLDYPNSFNTFSYNFGPFNRAQVIHDYLAGHDLLTFEEIRDLALNISSTDTTFNSRGGNTWAFVETPFTGAVNLNATPERLAALALFDDYDGHFVEGGEAAWVAGEDRSDAWMLLDAWINKVLEMTFKDDLGDSLFEAQNRNILFNVLLHGLGGSASGIVNQYDWFANSDQSQPQTADAVIVQALDQALAELGDQPWGEGERDEIHLTHSMVGEVHSFPYACRSTYAHCVEMGSSGPLRIESMFPLGESGTITMGAGGAPVFDDHFFTMAPVFDTFAHRSFPLFED